ncbi:DNA cytosine methyltransferase [Luteolibacter marinus]|uniref:DNA cytosine methyltransferase n=1 Tax=Luteolibacter marinus TaxID=2776705 RepID=UPI0031BB3450
MPKDDSRIPIIDLFAGPGGLGEGFSRYPVGKKKKTFRIAVSIEKDLYAHRTLTLRAFFRQFPEGEVPKDYYDYLREKITREKLFDAYPEQAAAAVDEAQMRTLGGDSEITKIIGDKIKGHEKWILIGGPPCQAYSLAGRSRMLGLVKVKGESNEIFEARKAKKKEKFEEDHRHTLYKEYLKVISDHSPPIFVMENVKGILSAKLDDKPIFSQILSDLRDPNRALERIDVGLKYRIHSFVKPAGKKTDNPLDPRDYLIRAENYGIPQCRHRVILLGVRDDIDSSDLDVLKKTNSPSVRDVIGSLPKLFPGLSRGKEGEVYDALRAIFDHPDWYVFQTDPRFEDVADRMVFEFGKIRRDRNRGREFVSATTTHSDPWYVDPSIGGFSNHKTRSHIREDLWRYFYCACFAKVKASSPTLKEFPKFLLPKHKNVGDAIEGKKFGDRFRVQCSGRPSTTITSHISKDGHYFIHPDPRQFRSLTVREAARLQTFPDNYRFEGPRTQQYHQVGNAVPPLLASQIAEVVAKLLQD